jgi:hypothetical protein
MKKILLLLLAGAVCIPARADTIKVWDFNSIISDFVATTGTRRPADGIRAPAHSIGGVGNRIGTVSAATQPPDPNTLDNSHWRLGQIDDPRTGVADVETGFPVVTNANKTAGALFPVNTSGYQNIQVSWNQENSATASRYWRVQYTTNAVDWLDTTQVITASSIDANGLQDGTPAWQNGLTANFTGLPGVDNNPLFAFRIVSEFEATATGSGTNAYVANRVTANYGTAGTFWLDLVIVTGDSLNPANQWPGISAIADQIILTNESTATLSFDIYDAETLPENLVVTALASDTNLIASVELGGSGGTRTIKATPVAGAQGLAFVTVFVQDQGGKVSDSSFEVAVTVPTIFPIGSQATSPDVPVVVSVISTNMPGDPAQWTFTAGSSNPSIVPNSGLVFGPAAVSNYLTITPIADSRGDTTITVTNSGPRGWQAVQSFSLKVLPPRIVFFDLSAVPNSPVESVETTNVAEGLAVSALTRGPGIGAANLTSGYSANGWNNTNSTTNPRITTRENAIADGEFYQFSVTVLPGRTLSISTIETSLRRSAIDAPMNYEWQYSLDGFATPGVTMTNFNYIGRSSGTAPTTLEPFQWMTRDTAGQNAGNPTWPFLVDHIAGLQNLPEGTVVTFRLYAWGTGAGADSNTVALGRNNGPAIRGIVDSGTAAPGLSIRMAGSDVIISWPASATGYQLYSSGSLSPANWQPSGLTPTVVGPDNVVTISDPAGTLFLRLVK